MADFPEKSNSSRVELDEWVHDNDRGLTLAAVGDWAEAGEAFAAAADRLARSLPSHGGSHEPLALVLSNLAQANFRSGRVDEALQHAQRVCALRVAIAGEDAMPVARARMDLAVMLATRGRLDEARTLVQRAINAVEHRVGEEDSRLATVLENAARIALASGSPANAEPLLIRLHALLDSHELPTARADQLLARVAEARMRQSTTALPVAQAAEALAVDAQASVELDAAETEAKVVHETPQNQIAFEQDDAASRVYAHASIEAHEEWEDQPLRDAVALTDVLLRTTPSGVPAISFNTPVSTSSISSVPQAPETPNEETRNEETRNEETRQVDEAFSDFAFDLADEAPAATESAATDAPAPAPLAETSLAGDADLMPLDLVEPTSFVAEPIDYPSPHTNSGLLLDFAVEHGVVDDVADEPMLQGPPISLRIPDAPEDERKPVEVPAFSADRADIVSSGSTAGIAPMAGMVGTAPPFAADARAQEREPTATKPAPPRLPEAHDARPVRRSAEERVVVPEAPVESGKGKLVAMIVAAVVVAGGAAAFFLLK